MRLLLRPVILMLMFLAGPALAQGSLIESRESLYNNIYIFEQGDLITMQFGKNKRFWTESVYDRSDDRALPVTYTRFMTMGLVYPREVRSILEIGLGGGRTAAYLNLHMPETDILSVELDPDVIELAKAHFGLTTSERFQIIARDGRIHMLRDPAKHDVIMVDAYRGPFVPFHLLTREFYEIAQARLAEGGVLVQNIEPTTMLFDAAVATIASVFQQIEFYEAAGNVVAVAYDGPPMASGVLAARAEALQIQHGFKYSLAEMLEARRIMSNAPAQDPLVDDFAPVEMLKSIERHNAGIDAIAEPAGN